MRISDWSSDVCSSDLDKHQKDIELILRTLAISTRADEYEKPMKEFLNVTMKQYKNAESMEAKSFFNNFPKVCDIVFDKLGEKPFNIKAKINASALDSVMGTLMTIADEIPKDLPERYGALLRSEEHTSELKS